MGSRRAVGAGRPLPLPAGSHLGLDRPRLRAAEWLCWPRSGKVGADQKASWPVSRRQGSSTPALVRLSWALTYVPQVERGLQTELTGCDAIGP